MKRNFAFVYDFDETLCAKDMYEYELLQDIGFTEERDFQKAVMAFAEREKMDRVAAMLYFVLEELTKRQIAPTREYFQKLGAGLTYFTGLTDWFERINRYAASQNIALEHYLVTSGNKEVIEGCALAKYFTQIYGCEFFYRDGLAIGPKLAMNYTAKTQFIFRIHKGILEPWREKELNRRTPEQACHVDFSKMVYFGDGLTDVACMQVVKAKGGQAIGIKNERDPQRGQLLAADGRVDYLLKADYSAGGAIEQVAQKLLAAAALAYDLQDLAVQPSSGQ